MKIKGLRVHIAHTDVDVNSHSSDKEVLVQAEEISNALTEMEAKPYVTGYKSSMKKLSAHKDRPDLVFNLVESVNGSDREMYRAAMFFHNSYYPYTGSHYKSLSNISDKVAMKLVMADQDILTPIWHKFNHHELSFHKGEYIIKPIYEHGSLGISEKCVVALKDAEEADDKIAMLFPEKPENFFAERYIDHREFNVSLLEINGEPAVLPLAEIVFEGYENRPKIVCEKAKWDESAMEYSKTVRTFGTVDKGSRLDDKIRKCVLKCWDVFRLSGYARVDIRVDKMNEPYVLEVNGNPSLAKDAGFCAAAQQAGYDYNKTIELIIKAAMRPK